MLKDQQILEEFGQTLMEKVRDSCYTQFEKILLGQIHSKSAILLHDSINAFDTEDVESLRLVVRDTIDSAIHHFLWMIEQYEEYDLIKYTHDKDKFVSLRDISDGLCGELYADNGWIEKYSKYPGSII